MVRVFLFLLYFFPHILSDQLVHAIFTVHCSTGKETEKKRKKNRSEVDNILVSPKSYFRLFSTFKHLFLFPLCLLDSLKSVVRLAIIFYIRHQIQAINSWMLLFKPTLWLFSFVFIILPYSRENIQFRKSIHFIDDILFVHCLISFVFSTRSFIFIVIQLLFIYLLLNFVFIKRAIHTYIHSTYECIPFEQTTACLVPLHLANRRRSNCGVNVLFNLISLISLPQCILIEYPFAYIFKTNSDYFISSLKIEDETRND